MHLITKDNTNLVKYRVDISSLDVLSDYAPQISPHGK